MRPKRSRPAAIAASAAAASVTPVAGVEHRRGDRAAEAAAGSGQEEDLGIGGGGPGVGRPGGLDLVGHRKLLRGI
jgi:hypothetical protein